MRVVCDLEKRFCVTGFVWGVMVMVYSVSDGNGSNVRWRRVLSQLSRQMVSTNLQILALRHLNAEYCFLDQRFGLQ